MKIIVLIIFLGSLGCATTYQRPKYQGLQFKDRSNEPLIVAHTYDEDGYVIRKCYATPYGTYTGCWTDYLGIARRYRAKAEGRTVSKRIKAEQRRMEVDRI